MTDPNSTTTHQPATSPVPAPARGSLFADPAAAGTWAAVQILDEPSKYALLESLHEQLGGQDMSGHTHAVREDRAIRAVREAAAVGKEEGEDELSVRAYRRLRDRYLERGWPEDRNIRRWLGAATWNDVLGRARLPRVEGGDVMAIAQGSAFTSAEVIAAVCQCAEETEEPLPSQSFYIAWARRPDVIGRPGHRPTSETPLRRLFGSWNNVLIESGLLEGAPDKARSGRVLRVSGHTFSDQALREALQTVARRVGHSPRTAEYERERERIIAEMEANGGVVQPFPSLAPFRRWGSNWDDSLREAGLEPLGGRATGHHSRTAFRHMPLWTDAEIEAIMREARADIGLPFTTTAYMEWVPKQKERDKAAGRRRRIPVYPTISTRYGTWQKACDAAFGA